MVNNTGRRNLRTRSCGVALVAGMLVALAGAMVAEPRDVDPTVRVALVGRPEPGESGRLAVRWDGGTGALLDGWVDLDGDEFPASDELEVSGGPLAPGIETVSFELPRDARVDSHPAVWAEVHAQGRRWMSRAAGAGATAEGRGACAWQPGFTGAPDFDGPVLAMTVFDDGSGPALYAGGTFNFAGQVFVSNIARWDGTAWSPMRGPSGTGTGGTVYSLAVFDDGSGPALYAGGEFTRAGGLTVNGIARWDGNAWSALSGPSGMGVDGLVGALTVYDDGTGAALYAGGGFSTAGGVTVSNIARWDGSAWSALSGPSGTGADGGVGALTVYDDGTGAALYAGGGFSTAGGVAVNHIARWDGGAWSALSGPSATGTDGTTYALAVYDDGSGTALYAGGYFITAGGVTVNNIARWNGSAWSSLTGPGGTGVGGDYYPIVRALAVYEDGSGTALYAGGSFRTAGGMTVIGIARWDGIAWSALTGPFGIGFGRVEGLAVYDDSSGPTLYVGGVGFAGGVSVCNIARWDGTDWSVISGPSDAGMGGADPWVDDLAVYDDGSGAALYAAGAFDTAGGVAVKCIARWDGGAWSALSGPFATGLAGFYADTRAYALAVYDDGSGLALYAGGFFLAAGGVESRYIARWDGSAWSGLSGPSGTGMGGAEPVVYALAVYDDGSGPALYAGGEFSTAGGVTVSNIARWDGSAWSALTGPSGTGVDDAVYALAVFDDGTGAALYAGGGFETAGGVTLNHIARWDGSAWSDLSGPSGTGADGAVGALTVYDDGTGAALYAGGGFETAGGVTVNSIARWDGAGWSPLSGPAGTGVGGGPWHDVLHLAAFDDGTGPALYAGGEFVTAGGVTVNNIARWDGSAWSALSGPSDTGTGAWVTALAAFDHGIGPTLYAGGGFSTAGGLPSGDIAAWRCPVAIFADGYESSDTSAWSLTVP